MIACGAKLRGLSRGQLEAIRDGRTEAQECEVTLAASILAYWDASQRSRREPPGGRNRRNEDGQEH